MGILYALIAAALGTVGNVTAKEWAERGGTPLFLTTLALYIGASVIFPFALRHGTLTVLNTLAGIVPIVITVGIGLWWYRETVTTMQMVGLVMGLAATVILSIPGGSK